MKSGALATLRLVDPTFVFESELWLWQSETATAWVFANVPEDESDEIADIVPERQGFGSIKVRARILTTEKAVEWTTSIFPSKEYGCYMLPVKKEIRRKARVDCGDTASIEIDILIT